MHKINFPSDYQQVMPYLIIKGAAGFMQFLKDVFEAKEKSMHMRDEKTVMHGEALIGESVIMFADASEQFGEKTGGFFVYVKDADVTFMHALVAGATAIMPVSDMPYGRSGGVTDPWGNQWWITTHTNAPNP